jgi:membrane peptidoglycan carboxypeptidase
MNVLSLVPLRLMLFSLAFAMLTFESVSHSFFPIPSVTTQYEKGQKGIIKKITVVAQGSDDSICERGINHKELSNLSDFSPHLIQAVIASEDSRFDWHLGADLLGILRAIKSFNGQGASTITQQVARTIYRGKVGEERSIGRKINEIVYAHLIELFYPKDEILKSYLNRVYLGGENYGFEAASKAYFGKSSAFLSVENSASLVSILPGPNSYRYDGDNALTNTGSEGKQREADLAFNRRSRVINRMAELGFINEESKLDSINSPLSIFNNKNSKTKYNENISRHFCDYIINRELPSLLGSERTINGGLIIETSLNFNAQRKAEKFLASSIQQDGNKFGYSQGAMLTQNLANGEIVSMAGGIGDNFNRAVESYRQPGSTFKIFVYLAALEKGITLDKMFSCDALTLGSKTYKGCERASGESQLTLSKGLILSENVISMRLSQEKEIGLQKVVETACKFGVKFQDKIPPERQEKLESLVKIYEQKKIELKEKEQEIKKEDKKAILELTSLKSKVEKEYQKQLDDIKKPYCKFEGTALNPGLVLGQTEVRLIDLNPIYAMIGNKGIYSKPHGIRKIRDAQKCTNPNNLSTCLVTYNVSDNPKLSEKKVSVSIANQLNATLCDAVKNGTGKLAGIESCGKTGTTDGGADMWFVGYNHSKCLATGIWLGNDEKKETKGDSSLAAKLSQRYTQVLPRQNTCI